MPIGKLQIYTSLADEALPVANVIVRIFKEVNGEMVYENYLLTDEGGKTPVLSLDAVNRSLSLDELNHERPYTTYSVEIIQAGYQPLLVQGVQIFDGELSELRLFLFPGRNLETEVDNIPDHHLLTNYGGSNVSNAPTRTQEMQDTRFYEENMIKTPERSPFVLNGVIIPRQIRVHLGRPTSNAENITVDFIYYIKNVCSSEVYPTWPRQALLANIHAQVSLALNRVYTEWYPSKGYNFDITNNTAFDQAFVKNRDIYDSISVLVDEVFNQYLRKRNYAEPFYAEYCDGKIATCPGMKQWGTLTLANQGMSAIQILQHYYTDEVRLVSTDRIEDVKGSYPGTPMRLGSSGDDVQLIQSQLNAIAVNYLAIPVIYPVDGVFGEDTQEAVRVFQRQFNLTADGVVGKSTWYKINYIYIAVRKLAELSSIGRVENELSGEWPGVVLRQGDRNVYVQQIQFYLSSIASFDQQISPIDSIDSYFGTETYNAVRSFQKEYGLTQDGVVGQATWNRIYEVYSQLVGIINPDDQVPVYPGIALRVGSSGQDVLDVQEALNVVGIEYPDIPILVEDGIYGANTREAVTEFQRLFGLDADGIVGSKTWQKLFEVANAISNGSSSSPAFPTYPGTALRYGSHGEDVTLIQQRLNFISIYYDQIPSINVDGIFGTATQNAVIAFQRMLGLNADGIVGMQTWNAIMEIYQELSS